MTTTVLRIGSEADLISAIETVNAGPTGQYIIQFGTYTNHGFSQSWSVGSTSISLTHDLPLLNVPAGSSLTIQGYGSTINGAGQYRGLLAYSGNIEIDDLTFNNTVAMGGAGGNVGSDSGQGGGAGGGGAGLGGGLFVASGAHVTIDNVNFTNTAAVGGAGGVVVAGGADGGGGGGGGGMGGKGGPANNGTNGGGGGGGIGVGADGTTNWYVSRSGASGSAVGLAAGGGGGWTYHITHYVATSTTDYSHGGGGGYNGGAGGDGYDIGGGGGGIGGQTPPSYYTGSSGFSLSLNWSPSGLALDLLLIADVISPEFALGATLVLGLYGALGGQAGAPGFLNQADFTLDGDGLHRDPEGANVPLLGKIIKTLTKGQIAYLYGFGLHVNYEQAGPGGALPAGGDGGFGGGGGGGGGSQGGWGGFGGGGGGSAYHATYGFGGSGGFGGGAGGYAAATTTYKGPGAAGFGGGASSGQNGGGGLGAGGAIFVQEGGSLTYAGSGAITGATVKGGSAGAGATAGAADGAGIFIQGGQALTVAPDAGKTITLGPIADQAGSDPAFAPSASGGASGPSLGAAVEGSVVVNGYGTVALTGTNAYLGGTFVKSGVLEITKGASLEGPVTLQGGSLSIDNGASVSSDIVIDDNDNPYDILSVYLGDGATFTGGVHGLTNGQQLRFNRDIGGNGLLNGEGSSYSSDSLSLNTAALTGASFTYALEVYMDGHWTTVVKALNPNITQYQYGLTDALQLSDVLQYIRVNQSIRPDVTYTFELDAGPLETAQGASYLLGGLGEKTVIVTSGSVGYSPDKDPLTVASIASGTILLQDSTVDLDAAVGRTLSIGANIIQAYGATRGADSLTVGAESPGAWGNGQGTVILSGVNTFNGGLNFISGTLELGGPQSGGNGAINFLGGAVLRIDSSVLPQNRISGFGLGDTIDLAGVSLPTQYMTLDAQGRLVFNAATGQQLNFSGLPTGYAFSLTPDGQGGTKINQLQISQSPATVAALAANLAALGTDTLISLSGIPHNVPLTLSQAALTLSPPSIGVVTIDGGASGQTIASNGQSQGFSISQGAAILENLNLTGFATPISVGSGGRIDLQSMALGGRLTVAAGGVLAAESGTTIGAVTAAGTFAAAPGVGGTTILYGAITGDLAIGDVGGTFPEPPVLIGGRVLAQAGATVSGTVYLDTDTTLELNGTVLGGASIVFNSPEGARLRLPNALPTNLISYAVPAGQIDIVGAAISGAHLVTVQAGGLLSVPNATGQLHFGAGVTVGETFLATSDGAGGTLLTPMVEGSAVSNDLQLQTLGAYIAALPSGGAPIGQPLQYNVAVSGLLAVTGPGEGLTAPSGVAVSLTDGAQAGGFVVDAGDGLNLSGVNTFTGGITVDVGATLTASSAAALGTGSITLQGGNIALSFGGAASITNVINGFDTSDTLTLSGVTAIQSGYAFTDFSGGLTIATASGAFTLNLAGLPVDTPFAVKPQGAAGTVITMLGRQTLTVSTEAQLDAAITAAAGFQGETIVNLAAGATISLSQMLPSVRLAANQSLLIDGHGGAIDGQGAQGGFYVAAGQFALANISLNNMLAQGGAGQWAYNAGGGGPGLGGALFIGTSATVSVSGVHFSGDQAVGGAGGQDSSSTYAHTGAGGQSNVNTAAAGLVGRGGDGHDGGRGDPGGFGGGGGGGGGGGYGVLGAPGGFAGGASDGWDDGGGGAGLGGAIFIQQGGSLIIGGAISETGNRATGGAGYVYNGVQFARSGQGLGAAIFSQGDQTLTFNTAAGQTTVIADQIADVRGNGGAGGSISITVSGAGVVELDAANVYAGTTTVQSGTLLLTGSLNGLSGDMVDNSLVRLVEAGNTRYDHTLSGAGSLSVDGGATYTFGGSINLGGTISILSGGLTVTGSGFSAGAIKNAGVLTLGGGAAVNLSGPITGSGAVVYADTAASSLNNINTTGALTVKAGTLTVRGANAFSSVTLAGGTLDLENPLTVANQVAFAAGVISGLVVGAGVAVPGTVTGFVGGDSIDLRGQVVTSYTLRSGNDLQLTLASGGTTDIIVDPGVNIGASASTNLQSLVFQLTADGAGGTVVTARPGQQQVASTSDLNAAISTFNVGGNAYQENYSYGLKQAGQLNSGGTITPLHLAASSTLYFNGGLTLGSDSGVSWEIQSGSVVVNGGGSSYLLTPGLSLTIDPGASFSISGEQRGSYLGYRGGVTDNGLLSIDGSLLAYNFGGSGELDLSNGTFEFQGFSLNGTLKLDHAYIPGLINSVQNLILGPGAQVWTQGISTNVTFLPGAAVNLGVTQLSGNNSTIYGFAPGDKISILRAANYSAWEYGFVEGTAVLGPNNVVSFYVDAPGAQRSLVNLKFDPNQNFAGYVFRNGQQNIYLIPTRYTAYNGVDLVSDMGNAYSYTFNVAANASYSIDLGADLTGAAAVTATQSGYRLATGDVLTINGGGHAISGLNLSETGTIIFSNLTLQNLGGLSGSGLTLHNVNVASGAITGGAITYTPDAGQVMTIAAQITGGQVVMNGAGVLKLTAANTLTGGVTVNSAGVLELASGAAAGAGVANSTFGTGVGSVTLKADAEIVIDSAGSPFALQGLAAGVGSIDFVNVAPSAMTITTVNVSSDHYAGSKYSAAHPGTATLIGGTVLLSGATGPLAVTADGAGGTVVRVAQTSFTATDGASLDTTLAALNLYGAQSASNVTDSVTLSSASPLTLSRSLPSVALASGSSLTVQGGGAVVDGGGLADGFVFTSGQFALNNLTLSNFAPSHVALTVGSGVTASLNGVIFADGLANAPAVLVQANGALTLQGGAFAAGSKIALSQGSTLTLGVRGGSSFTVAAAIDDPTGDGTGSGQATVNVVGNVVLQGANDFSGGLAVSGVAELAGAQSAGFGDVAIASGGKLVVDKGVYIGGAISGLASGGKLDLKGLQVTSVSTNGSVFSFTGSAGTESFTLSGVTYDNLVAVDDGAGGTLISAAPRTIAQVGAPTSLNLGGIHVGIPATQSIRITNSSAAGGESVTGGFGALGTGLAGQGALSLAPGQSGTLTLTAAANADGVFSQTAAYALSSQGANRQTIPDGQPALTVSGTAYAYARPSVAGTVNLGVGRVGGPALTGSLAVKNLDAAGDVYAEALGFAATASDTNLAFPVRAGTVAAGGSDAVSLSLTSRTAGVVTDSINVDLTSRAVAGSGLTDTSLGSSTALATGVFYSAAVASLPAVIDFGVVHVGDTVTKALAVTNVAAVGPYTDLLEAAAGSTTGAFTSNGVIADLAAGGASNLTVGFNTSQAGTFTGQATVSLASQDSAQADLTLASQTVSLQGVVDNYAVARLSQTGGGGTLTGSNGVYTLDLGTVISPQTETFSISNIASGLADLLSGGFAITSTSGFTNTGVAAFSGLAAGQSTSFQVTVSPTLGGHLSETLTISPTGSNASGYSGALSAITLTIQAYVPSSDFTVTTEDELNTILGDIDVGGALAQTNTHYTITLVPVGGTLSLTTALANIDLAAGSSLTLKGGGDTIDGAGAHQGFIVAQGAVVLNDLTLANMVAKGSAGTVGPWGGGGGGAGLGGGLYVASGASATLDNVLFTNNAAIGGAAGFGGPVTGAGDGGGADGGGTGSASPIPGGQGGQGSHSYFADYEYGVYANGVYYAQYGINPQQTEAQNGGFGGGGGASAAYVDGTHYTYVYHGSGFGGGSGALEGYGAGGGMAAGGDVFVQSGGSLVIDQASLGAGTLTGGAAQNGSGSAGAVAGSAIYLQGGGALTLNPLSGQVVEIDGSISAGSLNIGGAGVVKLTAASSFSGGATIDGVLDITAAGAVGSGQITLDPGGELQLGLTGDFANLIAGFAGASIDATQIAGGTVSLSGNVLTIAGGGQSLTLHLAQSNTSHYGLTVASDGHGGTLVSDARASAPVEALVTPTFSQTNIDFGNVHVGQVSSATVTVTNPLLQGGDTLVGGFGATPQPATGSGLLNLAPGRSGDLTVGLTAINPGRTTVAESLDLRSQSIGGGQTAISAAPITVTETAYGLASPAITVTSFGAARVGESLLGGLTISNGGAASAYQESLRYTLGAATGGLSLGAADATGTLTSGAATQVTLALSTATSGTVSGAETVALTSTGVGTSGLSDTALASQTVQVSGQVYAPAVAQFANTVDLGWGHVGDTLTGALTVTNGASGALTDTLSAAWTDLGGALVGGSAVTGLEAGGSGVLDLSLTSANAGAVSNSASLALTSHDAALADLTSTSAPITVTGVFLNYAQLGLTELSGGGTLTQDGNNFTLDLGTLTAADTVTLGITNTASGLADLLGGSIGASASGSGALNVSTSGLDAFSGLAAGQSDLAPTITITPVLGGAFAETITISAAGSNSYGYSGTLGTTTLTITGHFAGPITYSAPSAVANEDQLNADIAAFSAGGDLAAINTRYVITLAASAGSIALTTALDQINLMAGSSLTIVGNGDTLDGGGAQRGFVVNQGLVEIDNLTLAHMSAQGSAGGSGSGTEIGGGGGGAGLGGGIFVAAGGQVTLSDVTFSGDTAIGGAGGAGDSSGHGGFGGAGAPGGSPVGGLPGGIGRGGSGGYAANYTYPGNGGFGGGGGGGAAIYGMVGSDGAHGGFGAGNGGDAYSGGGGGGLGAGGDVFVADGGSLTVIGGSIGSGIATGGAGGAGAQSGQGLGGSVFLEGSGQISLDPASGQTIALSNGLAADGGGALVINGPGTVQVSSVSGLGGSVTIEQGTLALNIDPSSVTAAVIDNGAIVLTPPESGAVDATVADTQFSANDQLTLNYYDFIGEQFGQTFAWTGDLQSLADAINNAFPGGDFSAQVSGSSITISSNGADASYLISDQGGLFLEKMGAAASSGTGTISVTGVLPSPLLQPSDAVDLDGHTIAVGGSGQLSDLVSAINAANLGVTAAIDGGGRLQLSDPGHNILLSDAAGTPLATLGIAAGPYGSTHSLNAPVTGSGSVTINQAAGDTFVVNAAADWTGATTISAGKVVFHGDVSQLAGGITDPGAIVFNDPATTSLSASISGAGSVTIDAGGVFTLNATNSFTGGLTLTEGTLFLSAAGAASTGAIAFGAGVADLVLGQAITISNGATFANTLIDLGPTDQIDLLGLAYSVGATADLTGSALTVTSGAVSYNFTLANPSVTAFTVSNDGAGGTLLTPVGPNSLVATAQDVATNLSTLLATPGLDFITVADNGSIRVTVSQALNAGEVGRLHNQDGSAVKLEVVDTADTIVAHLGALTGNAHVVSLSATTSSASAALALQHVTLATPLTAVQDSGGHLSGAVLGQLQAMGVTAVTVQDNAPVVLSLAQFGADAAILGGLRFANGQTTGVVEISDSADNVAAQLPTLSADPRIASLVIAANAYNANVLIQDPAQPLTLNISGGGVVSMNPADAGVASVVLFDPPSPYIFTADGEAGLHIVDQNPGPDLIVVGDPSQSVTFQYGGSTVQATAANAGVLVQGAGGGETLQITTGGEAVLNAEDTNIAVVLDQATRLTLTPGARSVTGSSGDDIFVATTAEISAGYSLNGAAGANTLQLSGGGTFDLTQPAISNIQTLVVSESQDPAAQQIVQLAPGASLQIDVVTPTLDPANSNTAAVTIVGSSANNAVDLGGAGGVVTLEAAPGGGVTSTVAATLPAIGDQMTITYSDIFVHDITETFIWDGSLNDLASAITNAFKQGLDGYGAGYRSITAFSDGSSLSLTADADSSYSFDIEGTLATDLNGPIGSVDHAYFSLAPTLSGSDAINLNGTTVTVGGVGSLVDLAASINAAGLGVTAGLDAGGHLTLVSTSTHIALSDASGTPLETLGIAPGLYANATTWGAISGAGEAVFQQLATDNTVIGGAVTTTGGVDLAAGTLTFQGDVSGMAGLLTDDGTVVFAETGSIAVNAAITGAGGVTVDVGGTLSLNAANGFAGGVLLRSGTLTLNNAAAAGAGAITFGAGAAALVLGGTSMPANGATFANTLENLNPADTIDLKGLSFVTGAAATLANGVLTVTSGGQTAALTVADTIDSVFAVSDDGAGGSLITVTGVSQPWAALSGDALGALAAFPNLSAITVADNGRVVLNAAQFEADAAELAKLVYADGRTLATVELVDTPAHIAAALPVLGSNPQIGELVALADATTIGVLLNGGSDPLAINVSGGGTMAMNAGDTGVSVVNLLNAGQPYNFTANAEAGLIINDNGAAGDVVVVGSAGGTVNFSVAGATAKASAANAAALIRGVQGGLDTLEITGGGNATLNAGDARIGVVLDQATDLTLNTRINQVMGSAGNDTIRAYATNFTAAGAIDGGGGVNTLVLQGAGTFNLAAPSTLTNIQVINVSEGQYRAGAIASTYQTVDLRGGQAATVNVASIAPAAGNTNAPGITIYGASDSDILNLGAGFDQVYLGGAAETVNGGAGGAVVFATAATVGAALHGGAGGLTLVVTGGGAGAMNAADTGVSGVNLKPGSAPLAFTANAQAGLVINDSGAAGDTVTVGAASQTVNFSVSGGTAKASAAMASALIVGASDGGAGDTLEITGGGAATLNAGDARIRLVLDQATDISLITRLNRLLGSSGDDTVRVTTANLVAAASLDGGGGTNTLVLNGAGTFDLGAPGALANFQVISVSEGQYRSATNASTYQTINLRAGQSATVNVASIAPAAGNANAPGITLYGANDSDTINLGAGFDQVYLGSAAETVNGGAGGAVVFATAATVGALLHGGAGGLTLVVSGSGAMALNANDSGVTGVNLKATGAPAVFTANAQAGLTINDLGTTADTIVVGSAGQTVYFSTSGGTVKASAAVAGAYVAGASDGGAGETLEITGGGTATLHANDARIKVVLDQATDLTLNSRINQVLGSAGNDTVRAFATTLVGGAGLDGGAGTNTLALQGAGTFNLAAPTTLANFQVITVSEGQYRSATNASTYQTINLRAGQSATVNVTSIAPAAGNANQPGVTLYGANDADVINLGAGFDQVYLGSAAETVNGGAGLGVVYATAATAGALLHGGSGGLAVVFSGGGAITLNAADTGVTAVTLGAATSAYTFTAIAQAGLTIKDASTTGDTIIAGGTRQTLTGGAAGQLTMVGAAAGGDTFRDTAALFNGDTIKGFTSPGDIIDVTDLNAATLTATFTENAAGTAGRLALSDGVHSTSITLFGQFMAAGFSGTAAAAGFTATADGASGTNIAYQPVVAPPH